MTVVNQAWQSCQMHLKWARRHLQAMEEEARGLKRARQVLSAGRAAMEYHKRARLMLEEVRQDLVCFEAALRELAEGVPGDALVRKG